MAVLRTLLSIYKPEKEAKFNMEYEIEQLDSDDYCTISADDDYFVQFCNPPLPSFVADNATIGKFYHFFVV